MSRREEEEERSIPVRLDEPDGFGGEDVRHLLVLPARGSASAHVSDAADAVHDGLVVAVARVRPQEIRAILPRRLGADRALKAHADGIARVEPDDAMVLYVDSRNTIAGGRHEEGIAEADLERPGPDLAIPVGPTGRTQTQVPLPTTPVRTPAFCRIDARVVTRLDEQRRVPWQHAGALPPPWVLAGQHAVPRGRAGGRRRVGPGEAQTLRGDPIDVGRPEARGSVAADVTVPEVVGVNDHDVRPVGR
jgi:hypothetical protein